jgi:hypothetical protein
VACHASSALLSQYARQRLAELDGLVSGELKATRAQIRRNEELKLANDAQTRSNEELIAELMAVRVTPSQWAAIPTACAGTHLCPFCPVAFLSGFFFKG